MASLTIHLWIESDPVFDVANELLGAHEALAKRHGDRFRRLERDIEGVLGSGGFTFGHEDLGDRFVVTPPPAWTALLKRCRVEGVI